MQDDKAESYRTLPTDTILDRLPPDRDALPPKALALMKGIYLAFRPLQDCARANGWSQTQLIDAAETLRRKGCVNLIYNKTTGEISIQITSFGELIAAAHV